jgi:hypothetical protein
MTLYLLGLDKCAALAPHNSHDDHLLVCDRPLLIPSQKYIVVLGPEIKEKLKIWVHKLKMM